MRPISPSRVLSSFISCDWHEVAGQGVTGELERENLPPRCRELVACSQTRSRDKVVHELARTTRRRRGGRKRERRREREEKREMVRQLEALRKSHFQWDRLDDGRYTTRKARLRSGIRGMLCTLVDGHFYWDTFGTRLPRCSFMIVDCGSWESIQCTNEWNELICWMR